MIKRSMRAVLICVCLVCLAAVLPGTAYAADAPALTVVVAYAGQPAAGIEIALCRAADLRAGGRYAAAPAFASFGAEFGAMTTESGIALAVTLDTYAAANKMTRTAGTTDAQGRAVFAGLSPGLYLLAQTNAAGAEYIIAPSLALVTSGGATIYPKTERRSAGQTVSVSVYKVWAGAETHPPAVQAQLYRNGVAHGDPVILRDANHWRHNWTGLDSACAWTVDEVRVPDGYTKSISGNVSAGFVILNVFKPETLNPLPIDQTTAATTTAPPTTASPTTAGPTTSPRTSPTTARTGTPPYVGIPPSGTPPFTGEPPRTNDESNLALWVSLMGLSFLALAAVIIALWRQKRHEKTSA